MDPRQDDLPVAPRREVADPRQDFLRTNAHALSPHARDDTVRTVEIAAVLDLDLGPGPIRGDVRRPLMRSR